MATSRLWMVGVAFATTLSGCDLLEDWLGQHGGGGGGGGWHDTDDDASSGDHETDCEDSDVHDTDVDDTDVMDSGDSGEVEDTGGEDTADTGEDDTGEDDTDTCDTDGGWVDTDEGEDTADTGDTGDVEDTGAEDSGDTGEEHGCTFTQGYWKTHGPDASGNNDNEWPVTSLQLGTVVYTDEQLQDILDQPVEGNGLVALAHQLIAAKLNIANGADDSDIADDIAAADALIGGLVVPPVGGGHLDPSVTSDLVEALADFNEGDTGPGHCDDEVEPD